MTALDKDTRHVLWSLAYFAEMVNKQQMRLPGFPPIKPSGFKPPKMFDPDRNPEGKGYRVGTVRDWEEGPHIKTRLGWFPYDAKKRQVKTEDMGWVALEAVMGDKPLGFQSQYPPPSSFDEVRDRVKRYGGVIESDEVRHKAFAKMAEVTDRLKDYLERVKEDASIDEDMEDVYDNAEFYLDKAGKIVEQARGSVSDSDTDALVENLSEALENAGELTKQLKKFEGRKRLGHFSMKVKQDIGDNPLLKELAQEPVLMQSMAPMDQGYLNLTQIRTLKDGTKAIFKHDIFSFNPSARNEAASYLFMEKLLKSDAVPPTLLVSETPWSEDLVESAQEKFKSAYRHPEELSDVDMNEKYEGAVQELVEGETLGSQGWARLGTDDEAYERLMSIVAFDLISGNWDRNPGNIILDDSGYPHAIDNGEAFHYEIMAPDEYYVHEALEEMLSEAAAENPEMLLEAAQGVIGKLKDIKRDDLDDVLGEVLDEDSIRTVARRLHKVIDRLPRYAGVYEEG